MSLISACKLLFEMHSKSYDYCYRLISHHQSLIKFIFIHFANLPLTINKLN